VAAGRVTDSFTVRARLFTGRRYQATDVPIGAEAHAPTSRISLPVFEKKTEERMMDTSACVHNTFAQKPLYIVF